MYAAPASPATSILAAPRTTPSASPSHSARVRGLDYTHIQSHLRDHTEPRRIASSNTSSGPGEDSRTAPRPSAPSNSTSSPDHQRSRPREIRRKLPPSRSEAGISNTASDTTKLDGSSEATDPFPRLHPSNPSLPYSELINEGTPSQTRSTDSGTMTRHRATTAHSNNHAPFGYMPPLPAFSQAALDFEASTDPSNASAGLLSSQTSTSAPATMAASTPPPKNQLPTIRFVCHQDSRGARPSLAFNTIARVLAHSDAKIRIGRYSERDNVPETATQIPSDAPIGFKSKVVSRRHCEFWYQNNQWFIRDVKSSSGTFLNHIRLSQPGVESRPWPVHDGDIVQLGIDFKGGEEMIFRCVKIRVECNRGWQKTLNTFNKKTHKHLRNLAKKGTPIGIESIKEGDAASMHSTDCSICLMSIAPCQSLFVAPCSHTWHFKCIRPVIIGPSWPHFQCPNCRAYADLEADIDELSELEEWENEALFPDSRSAEAIEAKSSSPAIQENDQTFIESPSEPSPHERGIEEALASGTGFLSLGEDDTHRAGIRSTQNGRQTEPVDADIHSDDSLLNNDSSDSSAQPSEDGEDMQETQANAETVSRLTTVTTNAAPHEGPVTPRNDEGPFVLDGSGSRRASNVGGMDSLDRAISA